MKTYMVQKAVGNTLPVKWEDDKEFADLFLAENYARENYGNYTEPSKDLPMAYFGIDDKRYDMWNGRIIIKERD